MVSAMGQWTENMRTKAKTKALLTSQEVCELTGISYRQLDYWTRQGYVVPVVAAAGSGSNRLWDDRGLRGIQTRLDGLAQCPVCSSK